LPEPSIRAVADRAVDPHIRGFLHLPPTPNGNGLVLTHGAGSNANAPLLVALAETFSAAGFTALRCDLPYRQARSYGPPGPGDAARDRAGLKNAVAALKKMISDNFGAPPLADSASSGKSTENEAAPPFAVFEGWDKPGPAAPPFALVAPPLSCSLRQGGDFPPSDQNESAATGRIFLAGHSYGGRQSSVLCAEEPDLVAGLLLLSYPLHPPRRPEQQRTQHLPSLRTPALFVHGTRDPFGSIAEIEQVLKMIPAKTKLLPVEGAGHDLGFKGKAKREEFPKQIFSEFTAFLGLSSCAE
jgi:predicted alpha/beta-hydrolase family hydrolase